MKGILACIALGIFVAISYFNTALADTAMLHIEGTQIVTEDDEPFIIRSISMDGAQPADPESLYAAYSELYDMGFNAVRLQLTYTQFEDDDKPYRYKDSGWEWLERHLVAARSNGVRVILNMHEPQGGYQSWGGGNALWTEKDAQARLKALWGEIASRYREDATVLGYAPLNEPTPLAQDEHSVYPLWQQLATELVDTIRSADSEHIIFIERVGNWTKGSGFLIQLPPSEENHYGFPRLDDTQILYEFHQYWPHDFTHQGEHSHDANMPYTYYPNDCVMELKDRDEWGKTTQDSPPFDIWKGNYWQTLTSTPLSIDDPEARYIVPAVSIWEMGENGDVWIDEIYVDEYEPDGTYIANVLYLNFQGSVNFMRYADSGEVMYVPTGGKEGSGGTLYIQGVRGGGMAVLESARLPVKPGKCYKMTMSIGGSNLAEGCTIAPMLILHTGGEAIVLDKAGLAQKLDEIFLYGQKNKMPLFLGEFGTNLNSYAHQHGGDQWMRDMLELIGERKLSFNIFTYKNDYFGIYNTDGTVNELPHQTIQDNISTNFS